jgi:hypothetical protein
LLIAATEEPVAEELLDAAVVRAAEREVRAAAASRSAAAVVASCSYWAASTVVTALSAKLTCASEGTLTVSCAGTADSDWVDVGVEDPSEPSRAWVALTAGSPMVTIRPEDAARTAERRLTLDALVETASPIAVRGVLARHAARCRPAVRVVTSSRPLRRLRGELSGSGGGITRRPA